MSRTEHPRAMPAGDRRGPAREAAPRLGIGPLLAGVVALVLLRVIAAFVPGRWLWGLDLNRDVGALGFAVATLLPLVACVPPVFRALARIWPTSAVATWLLAVGSALALALFVHAHPDLTLWTGDTAIRHGEFTTVERPETIAKQAFPGDLFLHHALPRAIARSTGSTAEDVGRAQGALLAFLTAIAGWRLAATLGARGLAALAVAAVAACTAALALDNGYAKATTIANLSGRPNEAIGYFRRSTTINPDLASAWQGVAESAAALRDTAALNEAIGQLERLEPSGEALAGACERLAELRAEATRQP